MATLDLFGSRGSGVDPKTVIKRIEDCWKCPHRKDVIKTLPGFGCTDRPILLVIGQYPGRGEDLLGGILQKEAGKFIRRQFYNLGLTDDQIFWDNIVRCPLPIDQEELPEWQVKNCDPFTQQGIDALRPHVIVGLGNPVRRRFFAPKHMNEQRLDAATLVESRFHEWNFRGFPLIVVVNPAAVLRKKGLERQSYLEDVKMDFKYLGRLLQEKKLI